jgi:hypothetical protein
MKEVINELVHSWPKAIILYDYDSLILTHIASDFRVMLHFKYCFMQIIFYIDR